MMRAAAETCAPALLLRERAISAIASAQEPPALPAVPDASSAGRPWSGVTVNWHDWRDGGEARSPELDHDMIAMRTSGHARLTQIRGGKSHVGEVRAGNISLHPRGMESRWMWDRPGAILLLRVQQQLLVDAVAAVSGGAPQSVELPSVFAVRDQFIERMGLLLLQEVRTPAHPGQAYITQALSDALACHLVHRMAAGAARPERARPRMHPRTLRRVQEYIDAHLHEPIDLRTLAAVANVSHFHFTRMFRESAGMTAMMYLEQARMQHAMRLIGGGDLPIGRIASLVGYEDPSYFTKRFRLWFGKTPSAYARDR